MSYNRELESSQAKMQEHNENLKKAAAERLKKEAAIRKQRKAGKLI